MALAELETVQGRLDEAAGHLERVVGGDRGTRSPGWYGPHEQRAHLLVEQGRPAEAVREVTAGLDSLERMGMAPESGEIRWLTVRGLQAATELAEHARFERDEAASAEAALLVARLIAHFDAHLAAVRRLAGRLGPHAECDALLVAAERSRFDGRPDPDRWKSAADAFARMEHSWDEVEARWRQAEALLLAGRPRSEAGGPLRAAYRRARELGATPTMTRIEELARRARIELDVGPAAEQAVTGSPGATVGIESLTRREREVLALLAEGRTNREIARRLFISHKTASVHVTNIKEKLQVATRVEAAGVAIRLGIGSSPASDSPDRS